MEKQKQAAKPKETPEQRPGLYLMMQLVKETGKTALTDGVWLAKGNGKVLIKKETFLPLKFDRHEGAEIGEFSPGLPKGPKYTGPIDDEMMANILIYG